MSCSYSNPFYFLTSIFFILSLATYAQDFTSSHSISPQVTVHLTQDTAGAIHVRQNNETESRILFKWPGHELAEILMHDINADGYGDLIFVSVELPYHYLSRIFLYQAATGWFNELKHADLSFHTIQFPAGKKNAFSSSKYPDGADDEPYRHVFSIVNNDTLVLMESESRIVVGKAWPLEMRKVNVYDQDGSVQARAFYDPESDTPLRLPVGVSKLDLYTEPHIHAFSSMYLVKDDEFDVLDVQGDDWLQISYDSRRAGKIVRWVRYTDLEVDKYAASKDTAQGLSLTLLYPYHDTDPSFFSFSIGLDNQGSSLFESKNGVIFLLFTDEEGHKIPSFLYRLDLELKLRPKTREETFNQDADGTRWYQPGAFLDDNYVEWDEETGRYVLFHGSGDGYIEYVPFFPALNPGKYRMQAVFADPYALDDPVFSNEQEINYPIVKKNKEAFVPQSY